MRHGLSEKQMKVGWRQRKCVFFRRLSNISWEDKRTNDSVLEELGLQRSFLNEIKRRRLKYVGHAVRNPRTDLMSTVLQGKVEVEVDLQ